MTQNSDWWRTTTIYQVYPRSFMDSSHDGIGDLQGLISRLDYLQKLGIETIWVSPFFSSPQEDWGYDISDYYSIAAEFGNLSDVEQLIKEVHRRDMRILFDLVLNHTSHKHPWFQASRSSADNPKRDWYIWKEGKGSKPPNNWRSIVGSSGWNHDPQTDQWYYASFLPFQPDLNYRNPQVVEAMLAVARHWLDMGVDGFRLDIFHCLYKDQNFQDNPWSWKLFSKDFHAGLFFQQFRYNLNQPETIQFAYQLRKLTDTYTPQRMLLGEIFTDSETARLYLGRNLEGLHLIFAWNLLDAQPNAGYLRDVLREYEENTPHPYLPVQVYGNHDHLRLMSRIRGNHHLAMLMAVFQLTTRGVPVIYYGEEIGMSELQFPKEEWKDPIGRRFRWLPNFMTRMMQISATRDGCRSPMQWKDSENAGFSAPGIETWLPVNHDFPQVNVADQEENPDSLLNNYRRLLQIRRDHAALHAGKLELIGSAGDHDPLLAYRRYEGEERVLILLNFGTQQVTYQGRSEFMQLIFQAGELHHDQNSSIILGPYAAAIFIE